MLMDQGLRSTSVLAPPRIPAKVL